MNASEGIGLVMIRLAFLPTVIEPSWSLTPIAYAELMVQALNAQIRIGIHIRSQNGTAFIGIEPSQGGGQGGLTHTALAGNR